jgi:hypothetical protein
VCDRLVHAQADLLRTLERQCDTYHGLLRGVIYQMEAENNNDPVQAHLREDLYDRICSVVGKGEAKAYDPALIEAAPDLLRCLRGTLQNFGQFTDYESEFYGGRFALIITTEELAAIKAAIAKADGK